MSGHLQAQREGKGSSRAQDLLTQYFGIFFAMFQSSAVWGNLLSSLIFGQDIHIGKVTHPVTHLIQLYSLTTDR